MGEKIFTVKNEVVGHLQSVTILFKVLTGEHKKQRIASAVTFLE
jgi:hypothetical protein